MAKHQQAEPALLSILRRPAVTARTGMGRSALYAAIQRGEFPAPIRLGSSRAVGWDSRAVDAWIEKQIRRAASS